MAGAFVVDLYQSRDALSADYAPIIVIGFVVAFLSGLIVVKTMVDFIAHRGLAPFGWWRILAGGAGLGLFYFG
jgi:undecaprenyl-diphosphatase